MSIILLSTGLYKSAFISIVLVKLGFCFSAFYFFAFLCLWLSIFTFALWFELNVFLKYLLIRECKVSGKLHPRKLLPRKLPPRKLPPNKLPPMKIHSYESSPCENYPPEICPLENFPLWKSHLGKLPPMKSSPHL